MWFLKMNSTNTDFRNGTEFIPLDSSEQKVCGINSTQVR